MIWEQCKIKKKSVERERGGEREIKGEIQSTHFLILFDIYFCTADPLDNIYNCGGGEHMSVA